MTGNKAVLLFGNQAHKLEEKLNELGIDAEACATVERSVGLMEQGHFGVVVGEFDGHNIHDVAKVLSHARMHHIPAAVISAVIQPEDKSKIIRQTGYARTELATLHPQQLDDVVAFIQQKLGNERAVG